MRRWWTSAAAGVVMISAVPALARDGCSARLTLQRPGGPGGPASDFGRAMTAIGDIDGDGWMDLAVGDPEDATGGSHAGAVHLFSGRDGSLIRSIVGGAEWALGTALAACGDVNGDGVADVLAGAPGWQPPASNANTQPYKFYPVVKAMGERRVDFVCAAGDSNHFFGTFGFDGGIQSALIERVPMYATPIHSANENLGLVLTRWGSFIMNSTGGPAGVFDGAPAFFNDRWNVSAVPPELATLHRYAYWDSSHSLAASAVYGLRLFGNHPIDTRGELIFHIAHGTFAQGQGRIAPEAHLADPPYTHVWSWPYIMTGTPGGDTMTVTGCRLSPDPARVGALNFRVSLVEGAELFGPAFISWMRVENAGRSAGFSFSTLWAIGGKSARDAAEFVNDVPIASLTHYFAEARRLQGPDKRIVIYMNEGGNDRIDTRPSIHGAGLSWEPAGFRDNMTAVRDRILEVWSANGWPPEELYFLILGYHVLSDFPAVLSEDRLIQLRAVSRDLAQQWPRTTCIDMSAFMTESEAFFGGWYEDPGHAHLTSTGYRELGRRIVNAMFTSIARAGSARVFSGADGSPLFSVPSNVPGDAGDEMGYSVAAGPDADGDGVGDFIVGAPARLNDLLPGRAYLCSGVNGAVIRTLFAADGRDRFGETVALPGDLDGDGRADPVIGNPDDRQVAPGVGSLTAWGSASGSRLWRALGGQGTEFFATAMASVGDADQDGRADVVIGIPGRSKYGPNTGSARLYSGATGAVIATVDGRAGGERLGAAVAALGDLDSDGRGDFAAGAPGADGAGLDAGRVAVMGAAGLTRLAEFSGPAPAAAEGSRLGPAGLTPDGRREVMARAAGKVLVLDAAGRCCTGDLTGDGVADFTDYLEFLNVYEAGDARADLNRDGLIDFGDYLEFLVRYDIGC